PELGDGPREEGPSTPQVDGRAEDRRDPGEPRDVREAVPEQVGEHPAEQHRRHGQREIDPEQAPEQRHVVTVISAVRTVPAVAVLSAQIRLAGRPIIPMAGTVVTAAVHVVALVRVAHGSSPRPVLRIEYTPRGYSEELRTRGGYSRRRTARRRMGQIRGPGTSGARCPRCPVRGVPPPRPPSSRC